MICKYCGAVLSDEQLKECPCCSASLDTANEIPGESASPVNTEASFFDSDSAVASKKEKKPNRGLKALVTVLACLLVCAVLATVYFTVDGLSDKVSGFFKEVFSSKKDGSSVVAEFQDYKLTNQELSYYFYDLYNYMFSIYGEYMYTLIDTDTPLSEQESIIEGMSWQDYFVTQSIDTWKGTKVLYDVAQSNNFVLDEKSQSSIDSLDSDLLAAAQAADFDTIDEYIVAQFGEFADISSYKTYLTESIYTNAYYSSVYYDFYDQYSAVDPTSEDYFVSVRHILISPEDTSNDESWIDAEARAEDLYNRWLSDGAAEERFAELAEVYTDDTASAAYGGLYTDVSPGYMVEAFDAWCFDESRQIGDSGIVKTEFGYHIMYFVDFTNPSAYEMAETSLSDWFDSITEDTKADIHLENVVIKSSALN